MANLLDRASVVLTPTAYNNGEALCVKPSDGSGDFDFSRNSAATRVNAQGLVENVQILSSNLVQNGDFSEEGVQEVSNGSFSQEGVQLVTNGDFATDTDWSKGTGWSISGGSANCDGTQTSATNLIQSSLALGTGKIFKIEFELKDYQAGELIYVNLTGTGILEFENINANGTYVAYSGLSTGDNFITFRADADFIGSIDNCSVREVGQDWTLGTGISIGSNEAIFTGISGQYLSQHMLTTGKSYKLVFDVTDYTSGALTIFGGSGNNISTLFPVNSTGTYTGFFVAGGTNNRLYFGNTFIGSITNISVKEVGMDWTLVSADTSIGDSKLVCDNVLANTTIATQIGTVPTQKSVILKYDVIVNSGAFRILLGSGGTSTIVTTSGTYTFYETSGTGNSLNLQARSGGFDGSITNISVIEITDDTNLPRINYEGFSYQDALGSEEILNGDFSNGSTDWILNDWTVADGKASLINGSSFITQFSVLEVGKTYKIQYTISDYVSGTIRWRVNGVNGSLNSSNGVVTDFITVTSTTFAIQGYDNFTGSITNISAKEYLGQSVVPNSGCGSWLFENQSTNLITQSETFSDASWNASTDVIIDKGYLAPDGTNNATKVTVDGATPKVAMFISGVGPYTKSIYARTVSGTGTMYFGEGFPSGTAALSNVTEQWQRFEVTNTLSNFYAADFRGASTLTEVIIWGAQFEDNISYATSYIPTSGSTVTRNQDVCTNGGSLATINSTEGTLYVNYKIVNQVTSFPGVQIRDDLFQNQVSFYTYNNTLTYYVKSNNINTILGSVAVSENTDYKLAISYSYLETSLYLNGEKKASFLNKDMPLDLRKIIINQGGNVSKYKCVAVWKEALSDEELAELTYPTPTDPTFSLDFDTIAEQFTFARGSEATYVDAQGLIQSTNELGEEEIVNGDFSSDTAWLKQTGWTISGGKANSAGSVGAIYKNPQPYTIGKSYKVTYTISNYVSGKIRVVWGNVASTIRNSVGTFTEIMTPTGGGTILYMAASGSFTGSIDNVSVKEYITATNTPRLDYSTGAEAFLLEPQSTNLITYSSDFSNSSWTKFGNTVVTPNTVISPDGTLNASTVTGLSGTGSNDLRYVKNGSTANNTYTYSVYLKGSGTVRIQLSNGIDQGFDDTITLTSSWKRHFLTSTFNSTTTPNLIANLDDFNSQTATQFDIWGAQLEQQSYATSYIPTSGTTVTRNQETCIDATPEINSEEGVLYAEIASLSNEVQSNYISLSDGTYSNRISLMYTVGTNIIRGFLRIGGASQADLSFVVSDITEFHKVAFKFKENDFALWIDGVEVATDTNGSTLPSGTLTKLAFSEISTSGNAFRGNTKDLQVYTKALSDAELIKLTT
jgi:hypothetical protein